MEKHFHLLIKDPANIDLEIHTIVTSMFPDIDLTDYEIALMDMDTLFSGRTLGFERCDTEYHDWAHTLGVLLATARLLHGVHLDRQALSPRIVKLALIAALFHDCGYIRRVGEKFGTGGQFTNSHVQRSIELLEDYSVKHDWPIADFMDMESMIQCTDPACSPESIVFTNIEAMYAAHVLATADITSQMADDIYLEKLPFLFQEFIAAGISEFASEYDLFMKTIGFYAFMRARMENRLSNVIRHMRSHFKARNECDRDFYSEAILRNIDYLGTILEKYGKEYHTGLRRSLNRNEYPIIIAA